MVNFTGPIIVSAFWFVVGFVLPWFVPKGPNKGITQLMFVLTAVCCYVLWLTTFVAQLNPLFGPQLNSKMLTLMYKWGF